MKDTHDPEVFFSVDEPERPSYIPRNRPLRINPPDGHTSLYPTLRDRRRNRHLLRRGERAGWLFVLVSLACWLAGFWWMLARR